MPAESESQRRLFCMALSMKLGETPKERSPQAAKMAASMSEKQLRDYCEGKVNG